ncbi:MAG: alpha/beta hydrolase [Chloroflexota bacterium]
MSIDIISMRPTNQKFDTPLLFVHGAWHGNWCWAETFMPYFTERGFEVHALSLRGHDKSPAEKSIKWLRAKDYVADVATAVKQLPKPPIVIGHSMGGYVVQKYLETYFAPKAILLASVPPSGVIGITLKILRTEPATFLKINLQQTLYPVVGTVANAKKQLFSPETPDSVVEKVFPKLQEESYGAFLDMLLFNLPKPKKIQTPILVLGGTKDYIFSQEEVRKTAVAYNTEPKFFDMGHNMMMEDGWETVADEMITWLQAA